MHWCDERRGAGVLSRHLLGVWRQKRVRHVVINGFANDGRISGRDLDVFVEKQDVRKALSIQADIEGTLGWRCIATQRLPWQKFALYCRKQDEMFEIDIHPGVLASGPIMLGNTISETIFVGGLPVDPWLAFAKRVITRILVGKVPREIGLRDWEKSATVKKRAVSLFGEEFAERLFVALEDGDYEAIGEMAQTIRRTALGCVRSQPLAGTLMASVVWVRKNIAMKMRRGWPVVGVVGSADFQREVARAWLGERFVCEPAVWDVSTGVLKVGREGKPISSGPRTQFGLANIANRYRLLISESPGAEHSERGVRLQMLLGRIRYGALPDVVLVDNRPGEEMEGRGRFRDSVLRVPEKKEVHEYGAPIVVRASDLDGSGRRGALVEAFFAGLEMRYSGVRRRP